MLPKAILMQKSPLQKPLSELDHQAILRLLIDRGGDLAGVDGRGLNPLQIYIGPESTYSWLLTQGALNCNMKT
jgi:hypothetical protein